MFGVMFEDMFEYFRIIYLNILELFYLYMYYYYIDRYFFLLPTTISEEMLSISQSLVALLTI